MFYRTEVELTIQETIRILEEKLSPFITETNVQIDILAYYSNTAVICGDVKKIGKHEIYESLDLIKLIAMAGGPTDWKSGNIYVYDGHGNRSQYSMKKIFLKNAMNTIKIFPGYIVYVDNKKYINWEEIQKIITVILSFIGLITLIGKGYSFLFLK